MYGEKNYARWIVPIIIIVAVSIVTWDIYQGQQLNIKEIQQKVIRACQNQNFPQAIQLLEETLVKMPKSYGLRYTLVRIYLLQNQPYKAQQHLDICLKKIGEKPFLKALQAQIWEKQGLIDQAYLLYKKIIQQKPDMIAVRMAIIDLSLRKKDFAVTQKNIRVIEKQFPDAQKKFPDIYRWKGQMLIWQGKFREAQAPIERYLAIDPIMFRIQRQWYQIMSTIGKLPQARTHFQQQIKKAKPENKLFFQQLHALLLPPQERVAKLEKLLKKYSSPFVRMALISALMQIGRPEDAISHCQALKNLPPMFEGKRLAWLEHAYFLMGDYKKAREICDRLMAGPAKFLAYMGLINLELVAGHYEKAENYAKIAGSAPHGDQEGYEIQLMQARIAYEAGKFEMAFQLAQAIKRKALPGLPAYPHALFKMAQASLAQKKYRQAAKFFHEIEIRPSWVNDLRIRAAIWEGMAIWLSGQNPAPVWHKLAQMPWSDYIVDPAWISCLSYLAGQNSQLADAVKKNPMHQNDAWLIMGMKYQLEGKGKKAMEAYQKGALVSRGHEFPWYELKKLLAK